MDILKRSSGEKQDGSCLPPWPFYLVLNCFRYSRISDLTVLTGAQWDQRMTGTPSGPTRNFSKFQRTSWTFTGSQEICLKEPKSSEGWGQECWSREMEEKQQHHFCSWMIQAIFTHRWSTPPFGARYFNFVWLLINSVNYHHAQFQECCRCYSKCVLSLCFFSWPHHKIMLLWARHITCLAFGFLFC